MNVRKIQGENQQKNERKNKRNVIGYLEFGPSMDYRYLKADDRALLNGFVFEDTNSFNFLVNCCALSHFQLMHPFVSRGQNSWRVGTH